LIFSGKRRGEKKDGVLVPDVMRKSKKEIEVAG